MNDRIILSLVLFSFPLTCFSGIGGSIYRKPPSTLPDLPPSLPQDSKKIDFFQDLPTDVKYIIYDHLGLEELKTVGKVSKRHRIEKEYFIKISLIKDEDSSEDIISILTKYKKSSATSKRELPNPCVGSIEIKDHKIDSHILNFIIKSFPNLRSLTLHNAKALTDEDLEKLSSSCPYLTSLLLKEGENSNKFTDNGLKSLGALKDLTHLELGGCKNNAFTDKGLEHLATLTLLTSLHLDGNRFTDKGLEHLKTLTLFTYLHLNGLNSFTDSGLEHLKALTSLTSLSLLGQYSFFTDKGLEHLSALTSLTSLYLYGNNTFTDSGLEHLKALPFLTYFSLIRPPNTFFTDKGLKHLSVLRFLTSVNLEGNNIFTKKGLKHLKPI
jgi:hypothetical protein